MENIKQFNIELAEIVNRKIDENGYVFVNDPEIVKLFEKYNINHLQVDYRS